MKRLICIFTYLSLRLAAIGQQMPAEDYYLSAFNEISNMLEGKDTLSIKRAVFLAEWAYLEGKLDYQIDFCNEIGGLPLSLIINQGGGGATTPTKNGSYSIIVLGGEHPNGRAVTTGHEVIGHGRSWATGLGDSFQHIEAVRTENLILRVIGIPFINTGINHGPKTPIPNPSLLPSFR